MEEEEIEALSEQQKAQLLYQDTTDDFSELREQKLGDVINRLLKSDYGNLTASDHLKIFAQEMKTGNLDKQDMNYCNKVFETISQLIGFYERHKIGKIENNKLVKQLLVNAYSRLGLSNSRNGHLNELVFKNISEHHFASEKRGMKSFFKK